MNYKMICVDMDGTLLNTKHKVSVEAKNALKSAHSKGIEVVISTGRTYADAEHFSNLVGVESAVIASNGAIIKEKNTSKIIYKSFLEEDIILKLIDLCSKYGVYPMLITPEKTYINSFITKFILEFLKLRSIFSKNVKIKFIGSYDGLKKVVKLEKENIIKCEIIDVRKDRLDKVREEIKLMPGIEVVGSSNRNIEVTMSGVSKGKGVEILAGYYGIKREEVIAIGDSENDLSMIRYAGLGVAMGNASEEVKSGADYVTDTNENEGVAKAIYKFTAENWSDLYEE